MLSDGMMAAGELGLGLGSTEIGTEVEGERRVIEGEGCTATSDSVAVDVTIAMVIKNGVAVISIIDVVS